MYSNEAGRADWDIYDELKTRLRSNIEKCVVMRSRGVIRLRRESKINVQISLTLLEDAII